MAAVKQQPKPTCINPSTAPQDTWGCHGLLPQTQGQCWSTASFWHQPPCSNPQPWPWLANLLALWDWGAQHPWQALLPVCPAQGEGEVIVSTAVPGRGRSCRGLADVHVTQGEISALVLFHARRGARCSMSQGEAPGRCQQQPRCSGQPETSLSPKAELRRGDQPCHFVFLSQKLYLVQLSFWLSGMGKGFRLALPACLCSIRKPPLSGDTLSP